MSVSSGHIILVDPCLRREARRLASLGVGFALYGSFALGSALLWLKIYTMLLPKSSVLPCFPLTTHVLRVVLGNLLKVRKRLQQSDVMFNSAISIVLNKRRGFFSLSRQNMLSSTFVPACINETAQLLAAVRCFCLLWKSVWASC